MPIGKARIAREGGDVTVITYGEMVRQALEAAGQVGPGISAEVIDLRTLKPLDRKTILASVRKTGRVVVVHAANRMAGIGAEIAAELGEVAFEHLDAPVTRLGGLDIPVPFSPPLEDAYRPDAIRYRRGNKRRRRAF